MPKECSQTVCAEWMGKARRSKRAGKGSRPVVDASTEEAAPSSKVARSGVISAVLHPDLGLQRDPAALPQAADAFGDGARPGRPRNKSKRKQKALARLEAQQATDAGQQQPGSNWTSLKQILGQAKKPFRRRQFAQEPPATAQPAAAAAQPARLDAVGQDAGLTSVLAIDCEMVGCGPRGSRNELARVCVVNNFGVVILDSYVRPYTRVVDYRTKFSGVRARNLADAPSPASILPRVAKLLEGRLVVGHALHNDFKVLGLKHPPSLIRDTSKYPPLMKVHALEGARPQARRLRDLAKEVLGLVIQTGEHSPVDDARASLYLYHRHYREWEDALAAGRMHTLEVPVFAGHEQSGKGNGRSLHELAAADDMVDL